ncbi:MAG: esterase-like activity of phytase family protein [Geminicoccaceae bacterium]|nr:esterase-like activity of phytase family protein [Geminicoccaceae bacterium]MCX7630481.1 esterase-like activity of phytase family protein [Geminicoccaceae bacterium]MDW8369393.1 esterase-like activity of phytase family protein [Geminicoccaceae bacterium]
MRIEAAAAVWALGIAVVGPALAGPSIELYTSEDPALRLGSVAFEGGKTLELAVGIGSAAFRRPDAPDGVFVTLSDRGPNFPCADAKEIVGVEGDKLCAGIKGGRIYPLPDYSPTIYRIEVKEGGFRILNAIPITDRNGRPVTGMPNPLSKATTETPVDATGKKLAQRASAIDAEGIVELADGSFWIGEENATSILHVAADGKVLRRLVPAGSEADFAEAGYPVEGKLPPILTKRQLNRGIESVALGPDERFLWFILQNPLANPDAKAYQAARNTRLFQYDRREDRLVGEYVYELTPMAEFKGEESKAQSTARISELLALDAERFLLVDRTERTTKIVLIDTRGATNILGSKWDDPATTPTLEQTGLAEAGIVPVTKKLVLDSSAHPELPVKIEGMAWFADGSLMLINDDDFGIDGRRTIVARIRGLELR